MAIDSRDKRASALNTDEFYNMPAFEPDGVMTQSDRQDVLGNYRGILAAEPGDDDVMYPWWLLP